MTVMHGTTISRARRSASGPASRQRISTVKASLGRLMLRQRRQSSAFKPPPLAGLEIVKTVRTNSHTNQTQHGETDMRGHAAYLSVAPLAQGQLQPAGGHGLAKAHRRIARPQPVGLIDPFGLGRVGESILEG